MPPYPVEDYVAEPCYTPCLFNQGNVCKALTRRGQWSTSKAEAAIVVEEARGIVEDAEERSRSSSSTSGSSPES